MRPMLARTLGLKFNQFPCYVQPKLNGVRALSQGGIFQSRDEKLWNPNVLRHLENELEQIKQIADDNILDGELYVHGWRLQRINGAIAVNRLEPNDDTRQVEFHVFDVVDLKKSFSERYFDVNNALHTAKGAQFGDKIPHIKPVDTVLVHNRDMLDQFFHYYTSLGYEGIMLRPDGPYEFGEHLGRGGTMTSYRSRTLWKHKQWEDGEWFCVGITPGEGKADIGIGALVLARGNAVGPTPDSWTFKVGTGFTDEERIEFMNNPPIRKKVKVRYLCLTADGIPFNPSFLAVLD